MALHRCCIIQKPTNALLPSALGAVVQTACLPTCLPGCRRTEPCTLLPQNLHVCYCCMSNVGPEAGESRAASQEWSAARTRGCRAGRWAGESRRGLAGRPARPMVVKCSRDHPQGLWSQLEPASWCAPCRGSGAQDARVARPPAFTPRPPLERLPARPRHRLLSSVRLSCRGSPPSSHSLPASALRCISSGGRTPPARRGCRGSPPGVAHSQPPAGTWRASWRSPGLLPHA